MSGDDDKRRTNGLEKPWHPLQMATWVLFPLLLVYFYAFLVPLVSEIAYVASIAVVFGLTSTVAAVGGYLTCATDPIDDFVLQQERDRAYCYLCTAHIKKESRHCVTCKKCVDGFDHHCKWLNTCVGAKNYRYFLTVVSAVTIQTSLVLAVSCEQIVAYFAYHDSSISRVHGSVVEPLGSVGTLTVLVIGIAFMLPLVVLVWQLQFFHIMLVYRGLTTYDFIVLQHRLQQERQQQRRLAQNNRSTNTSRQRRQHSRTSPPVTRSQLPTRSEAADPPLQAPVAEYKALTLENPDHTKQEPRNAPTSPQPPSQTVEVAEASLTVSEQADGRL